MVGRRKKYKDEEERRNAAKRRRQERTRGPVVQISAAGTVKRWHELKEQRANLSTDTDVAEFLLDW